MKATCVNVSLVRSNGMLIEQTLIEEISCLLKKLTNN